MGGNGAGRAYIGSFTAAGGPGILTAHVNAENGALTALGAADLLPDPSYLALSPAKDTLYAVSETPDGAVAAFDLAGDKPELRAPAVPVGAEGPTHLSVHAGHLLTANYGSGSISALPLRGDGTIGPLSDVLRHQGSGPHPQRQQGPHAHQVLADPSGRWLLGVDLGTDSVHVYALRDGTLRTVREVALRPGSGPRHLAFHPRGDHAYLLNELAPTVTVCRWDAADGVFQPMGEMGVLTGVPAGDAYPSELVVSPDGRFLWVATRGQDVISVLALDATGEGLRLVATVRCGGRWPRDLVLSPSGRHLYVANERSGDVTWFETDPETGLLRRGGAIDAPAASCVVLG